MSNSRMQVMEKVGGIAVIRILGDFTNETTPDFQKICENVRHDDTKGILLDFDGVLRIDSAAFACMISFSHKHAAAGVKLGIVNLKTQERELLDLLRINSFIRVFESKAEAISAFT